ncbi:hypothetical protein FGF66_05800 [Chlorobaculum thiosulfatiphilum]|jgi:hypothetical protein|uniref:Uncharacterized protein n=1 Tax=Chlorobaculum thiosulfatiphilum TaxID=115852 RepID=A0A5C4S6M6_CHLTI|nr:hypothetical protein [Chlorobaculum thiosulfatiphilum]TNJ39086.1 hypothetical protein FGF66_05800 [Chlorobaculum thiosulfatiphilum]
MLKFILLLIALWLAMRLVGRLVRITTFIGGNQNERRTSRSRNFSSPGRRKQVEEAEYEVIDSQIKQKE